MLTIQPIKNPRCMNSNGEVLDCALVYDGITLQKLPSAHAPYRLSFLLGNPEIVKRMVKRTKRALKDHAQGIGYDETGKAVFQAGGEA